MKEPGRFRDSNVFLLEELEHVPVKASDVQRWTQNDPVLSQVKNYVLTGWPDQVDDIVKPFTNRKTELSVEDGCVSWGSRVVVPNPGRNLVLEELHQAHPGMSKMKGLARSYMWWPNTDKSIEAYVKSCEVCATNQNMPEKAPLHPWEMPTRCWSRMHVDYAGPSRER